VNWSRCQCCSLPPAQDRPDAAVGCHAKPFSPTRVHTSFIQIIRFQVIHLYIIQSNHLFSSRSYTSFIQIILFSSHSFIHHSRSFHTSFSVQIDRGSVHRSFKSDTFITRSFIQSVHTSFVRHLHHSWFAFRSFVHLHSFLKVLMHHSFVCIRERDGETRREGRK
jgi:hypothetical protein